MLAHTENKSSFHTMKNGAAPSENLYNWRCCLHFFRLYGRTVVTTCQLKRISESSSATLKRMASTSLTSR
jgi:hypothetical protein